MKYILCPTFHHARYLVEKIYEELNSLIDLKQLQKFIGSHPHFEEVVIYGSRAKGTNTSDSDIDIIVIGKNDCNASTLLDLKHFLDSHMSISKPLDITMYDIYNKKKYFASYGSDIMDDTLAESDVDLDFTNHFFRTPCFHLDGKSISYDNELINDKYYEI